MDDRRKHPSGRPVRKDPKIIGRPRWNIPDVGYVTPGLKEHKRPDAIGFVANHLPGHQSDED